MICRGFDVICVCPLIEHGQQPMKMHTEVTLLYNTVQLLNNDAMKNRVNIETESNAKVRSCPLTG